MNEIPFKIEVIDGSPKLVLGDGTVDILLKTLGNVLIDTGDKTYKISSSSDGSYGNETQSTSVEVYSSKLDLPNIDAINDNSFVYIEDEGGLYIKISNKLVLINNRDEDKIFLSFIDEQTLTSEQKKRLLINSGSIVNKKSDLYVSFSNDTSYDGMCVYVIEDKTHYKLVGNPISSSSWLEMYISTQKGGEIESAIVLKKLRGRDGVLSLLTIDGFYNKDKIESELNETISAISIGSRDLKTGLVIWTDESGNSYISSQNENPNSLINFITSGSSDEYNVPLKISNTCVAVNSDIDNKYNTILGGLIRFQNNVYTDSNISTERFVSGFGGYGFKLYKNRYSKWALELDELRVRGRMDVYELVINQIRAQNGSLWVTDGVKMQSVSLSNTFDIFIKNTKAGRYILDDGDYKLVTADQMPMYYKRLDINPIEHHKIGLGYGDHALRFNGTDFVYEEYNQTLYNKNHDGSFSIVNPTHSFDSVNNKYIEDTNGDYVKIDTVNVFAVTCDELCPFVVGDLVRMQKWDPLKNSVSLAFGRVSNIISASYEKSVFEVHVYEAQSLEKGAALVRTGNQSDSLIRSYADPNDSNNYRTIDLTDKDMLSFINEAGFTVPMNDGLIREKYPERTGAVYITSCDSGSPFIDILDGMNTHNAFDPSEYPDRNIQVQQDRLKARLGKLDGITDLEMGLTGSIDKIYGIYSDNGFFRCNIVAKSGKIGGYYLHEGALFTFYDGIVNRIPSQFVRSDLNFLYIKADGTGSNNPMDNGIINNVNINKLFSNNNTGLLLDPVNDSISFGNKLSYKNGTLVIGEVDGIGDLVETINNISAGVDTDFINALKGNFTSITGGLISTSVVRLGSVTRDVNNNITGWVDRAGMSGLDDSGETSVRLWAGSSLADRNTAPFRILQNGNFYSTRGEIAGWTIADDALYKDKDTVGTGMFSSATNNVAFYAGTTYANLKANKENAAFYVLDDGSFKSTKGVIGSINIANNKLYTSYSNGYDKMRLDNNGLSFFEESGLEKAGIKNTAYTLSNFINGNILSFNFYQTYLSDASLESVTLTVTDDSNFGAYDSSLELTSLEISYNVTLPAGYEDPGTYDITVNYRTDFILTVQKLNGAVWEDYYEIGRIHKEVSGTTIQNNLEYFVGSGINHITGITQITSQGSYRVQLTRTQDIDVVVTDSSTNNPITPTSIVSGSRLNMYPHLPSSIAKTVLNLKRTGTFMHLKGLTIYSSTGSVDNFFNIELDTTGFFLNSKGSFQIVSPAGSYSNIPGVLIAGEVNGDGSSVSYWRGGASTAITRRTAQGRYEVDVRVATTHTDWYPSVLCKYNQNSFIKAVAQVTKENVNVGGLIYNRLTINVFDSDNGISIDCPFYFYVFGRNEELTFI